jgi:hypothetical protein
MQDENDFVYNDEEAIACIRNYLPQELKEKFSDDDIVYVTELIYEYYDSQGFFEREDVVEIDEDEILQYVLQHMNLDGQERFTPEEATFIVQGEMAYCESIHLFE